MTRAQLLAMIMAKIGQVGAPTEGAIEQGKSGEVGRGELNATLKAILDYADAQTYPAP